MRPWPASSQVQVLSVATVPEPNAPDPLHLVPPLRLELLARERTQLRALVERTAAWLRDNAIEKHLQIETAVIDGRPKEVIVAEAGWWEGAREPARRHGTVRWCAIGGSAESAPWSRAHTRAWHTHHLGTWRGNQGASSKSVLAAYSLYGLAHAGSTDQQLCCQGKCYCYLEHLVWQ